MATPNRIEYLEVDALPLATPAWEVTNLDVLWQSADPRGDNDVIPYRRGRAGRRHLTDSLRVTLQMVIEGSVDSDGNPASAGNEREQLEANINELKTTLRPRQNVLDGAVDSILHNPTRDLYARTQIRTGLRVSGLGPGAVLGNFDIEILGGVFLDSDNPVDVTVVDVPGGGSDDLIVPNPGTADQLAAIIDLTGTATSVILYNETWDPTDNTYVEFGGAMEDTGVGTTLDTDAFTAVRNGLSVIGLVSHSGHETWLPLLAGQDNVIRVEPTGGTATVQIQHVPRYA